MSQEGQVLNATLSWRHWGAMDGVGTGEFCAWIWEVGSGQSQAVFSKKGPCFMGPGRKLGTWGEAWASMLPPKSPQPQGWHGSGKQPNIPGLEAWKQGSPVVDLDTWRGTLGARELEKA